MLQIVQNDLQATLLLYQRQPDNVYFCHKRPMLKKKKKNYGQICDTVGVN